MEAGEQKRRRRRGRGDLRDRRPLRKRGLGRRRGRARGGVALLLAGPEKAVAEADSKPDGYLTAKIDAVDALSDLLTRLGA